MLTDVNDLVQTAAAAIAHAVTHTDTPIELARLTADAAIIALRVHQVESLASIQASMRDIKAGVDMISYRMSPPGT